MTSPDQDRWTAQLDAVVDLVRAVLAEDAIAAYLSGSAVQGGLRPTSDLDVFVVSRRPTTPAEKRALVDGLLPISGSRAMGGPARSIELTIAAQAHVRPWRYPPILDFQYGDWLRPEFERGELPPWPLPNPDLAVLVTTVRLASRPLFGPRPEALLDPVPRADLVRAMLDGIPGLLADLEDDTRNVLLTLARIWVTIATGEIRPKDDAADWVLARLPDEHRPVLAHARAIYRGEATDQWDDLRHGLRRHVDHMVGVIERLGGRT